MTASTVEVVEVRCPVGPQRLFTKLGLGQVEHRYIQPENFIEFSCTDCANRLARRPGPHHGQRLAVLHRFNFLGELIETLVAQRQAQPNDR